MKHRCNVSHAESASAQEEPQRIQGPKPRFTPGGGVQSNCGQPTPAKEIACLSKGLMKIHMGVSKDRGTPKWTVYNGKPYSNG